MKKLFTMILCLLVLYSATISCYAGTNTVIEGRDLEFLEEYVPIYSFQAVTVDDSGAYAVLSRYQKEADHSSPKWVCIEVFEPDGGFRIAFRFMDAGEDYIRLDGDMLYLYQLDRGILIDLRSRQIQRLEVGYEKGLSDEQRKELRKTSFEVGNWRYSCKRGIGGMTRLSRTDGTQTQVLLELKEQQQFSGLYAVIIGIPAALLLSGFAAVIMHRKRAKKKEAAARR